MSLERDAVREALAWALDLLDMNDALIREKLPETWTTLDHETDARAKAKARALIAAHPAPPATEGEWERVAREAWDEGREAAWRVAEKWANSKSCEQHDDNPCCHVRVGVSICNAIRVLQRAAAGDGA